MRQLARDAKAFAIVTYQNGSVVHMVTDGANSFAVANRWEAERLATAHNVLNQTN